MPIIIPNKVNPLVLSYTDFTLGSIINPDEFDQNNLDVQDKLNEFIDVVNITIDNTVEIVAGKADVAYVNSAIANATIGLTPEGALTDNYLSNEPGQIKDVVSGLVTTTTSLQTDVAGKVSMNLNTGTIPTTGWVTNTGDYVFKIDVAITGILSTDSVDVFIDNDVQDVANDSELSPNNDSYDGGITFYAKTEPLSPITFSYRRLR